MKTQERTIPRICSWCDTKIGEVAWEGEITPDMATHGMCGECRADIRGQERVRITALIHERVISYVTDRLGAALRLKMAKKLPGFKGHSVQAVP